MNKLITFLILGICALSVNAQTQTPVPTAQPYGKINQEDLEMKSCDFEKDANAEVLFNLGKIYYGDDLKSICLEAHRRIKIFNDKGNDEATIRIPYYSLNRMENITRIEAETINVVDGKTEVTRLDKKQIFANIIDKDRSEITFTFPNVKPGCIIEYKYKWTARYNAAIPSWRFQERIPVRYSELSTAIPNVFYFRVQPHFNLPLTKHSTSTDAKILKVLTHTVQMSTRSMTGSQESDTYSYNNNNETWGMANIPSLHEDVYISSFADNVQRLNLDLVSIKPIGGFNTTYSDTWAKVGGDLADDDDFGSQLNRTLNNEQNIISKAALIKAEDEKIAFIFNEVKSAMKWNGADRWYTNNGTYRAWENKTGNSTEINLILYHLLKKSGIDAYPMVASTRENGKVDPNYTSLIQFNRTVVYIPVDGTKNYVLDATDKYNLYNETPAELLNSMGLFIDKSKKTYGTVYLKKDLPVRQVVLVNAEIKPDGKLAGTIQINSASYDRINAMRRYKTDGEQKYIEYLKDGDNNLKISSVRFENMEIDTLPLTQNVVFNLDLVGSDENYIYLNTNLFTGLKTNPFLSENRITDIDFGYCKSYSINGAYKIPNGYKAESLPKNITMDDIPDQSVNFKRFVTEKDGVIKVQYNINFNKPQLSYDYYDAYYVFFKQMYELLNEQIVLKKL